jgi:transcriptional regulator with XRE-family HTH domain
MSTAVQQKIDTLVRRRTDLGITQRELDKQIGVSDCMVAKWESGQRSPTAESLERWAGALGLRVELVGKPRRRKAA